MFGAHFYHEKTRKCVAAFGKLFNNIYVLRTNSSGGVMSQVKVPLSYAPKDKLLARIRENADLSNNYGNLIQRISSFIIKNSESRVSKPKDFNQEDQNLINSFDETYQFYLKHMNAYQIDRALKNIFEYLSEVNAYVDIQAPWSLKKLDQHRMNAVLYIVTFVTIKCSILLYPIIPDSIIKVLNIYNLSIKLK